MRSLWLALLLCLMAPVLLAQQAKGLEAAAESARRAWAGHDPAGLVASSPQVLVRLPGVEPSAPVSRAQAAALVRDYLRRAEEVSTEVGAVREAGQGRGLVELVRRYRMVGTQQIREQRILLSYEQGESGWVLSELRIGG